MSTALSAQSDRSPSLSDQVVAVVRPRLGIDWRALAVFRLVLGLILLTDLLVIRAPELTTFYTDDGVVPRSILAEQHPLIASWSLHALSGSVWLQRLLFAIAAIAAVCLLVGYRSQLAAGVSCVLLASLHARNPYLINGGDVILVIVLFLAAFLPLGARWALDSRPSETPPETTHKWSIPTTTVLLFIVLIYATNAVFKHQSDLWVEGVAVKQIFFVEPFIIGLGPSLTQFPTLLVAINWLWMGLLAVSLLLLVVTGWRRALLVAAFVGSQLGMAMTMRLGIFPFVMLAGLLLFFPPSVWDRLEDAVHAAGVDRYLASLPAPPPLHVQMTVPATVDRGLQATGTAVVTCVLVALLITQAAAVGAVNPPTGAADVEPGEYSLTLFAPNPPSTSGWYRFEAELASGETTDPLRSQPVDRGPPADAADTYPTVLWHRYLGELRYADESQYEPLTRWLCEQPASDVETVTVTYVEQAVGPDGPKGEPQPHEPFTYRC